MLPRVRIYYAPREYLDDLPARVSSLLGCLAVTLCLPKKSLKSRIRAGMSRENDQVTNNYSAQW
jgi:hypothetical protein